MKDGETRISKRNFYIEDFAELIRRSLINTTELVKNHDRSQFISYSQINQYLCTCLKPLKKKRYAGQSVIYTETIKSEKVNTVIINRVFSYAYLQQDLFY